MSFGIETYNASGVKQIDPDAFNYSLLKKVPTWDGVDTTNTDVMVGYTKSMSTGNCIQALYGLYGLGSPPSNVVLAYDFPPAGRYIGPYGYEASWFNPVLSMLISGSAAFNPSGYLFAQPTENPTTGFGLVVYGPGGEVVFAYTQKTAKVVAVIDASAANLNNYITVDPSRQYAVAFCSSTNPRYYTPVYGGLSYYGLERNYDRIYVRLVAGLTTALYPPAVGSAQNLAMIFDVTNL